MAYVSLYRKYRPQTFDDVVGQTQVIRTLANAIAEGRLHHAYLFTGPRGTGKTSTARILAKAINCEEGPTATPCNTCRQCQEITEGSSVDVIELDMASHGGVDDARELRDRALFAPASARRKVYILDEVHMASTAAFNALLKLIEEPPEHVLFAMATTDPQKVLPTIMSRVQRLDLRRVSAADVAGNVRELCEAEGYRIEDAAVEAIVRAGDGSLRDTQSVLEQVLAFTGTEVTADAVQQVLGQTPTEKVAAVVDHLGARDISALLAGVQQLVDDGHDLRRFTLDLVNHLRDLLVLGAAPEHPDLVDATDERRALLQQQASALPADTLLRSVRVLAETVAEQRVGSPRLPLELALATLVVPSEVAQLEELTDRLARLEAGSFPTPAPVHEPESQTREVAAIAAASLEEPSQPPTPDEPTVPDEPTAAAVPAEPARQTQASPPSEPTDVATPGEPKDVATSSEPTEEAPPAAPTEPAEPTEPADLTGAGGPPEPSQEAGGDEPAAETGEAPEADPGDDGSLARGPDPAAPDPASPDRVSPDPVSPEPVPPDPAAAGPVAPDPTAAGTVAHGQDGRPDGAAPETAEPVPDAGQVPDAAQVPDAGQMPDAAAADAEASPGGSAEPEADDLEQILARWEAILEVVREGSRRHHAVFAPAKPVRAGRGILTLRYGRRYASFHAANAAGGDYATAMQRAVEQTCGLRVRLDIVIEGEDDRRRPQPPSVTPEDARTPVLHGDGHAERAAPSANEPAATDQEATEEIDVREAEAAGPQEADPEQVGRLLADELGAELVDERPPPE